jgi:alcohol dehydrogenase
MSLQSPFAALATAHFESGFLSARIPAVYFAPGSLSRVPGLAAHYGRRVLLVRGAQALENTGHLPELRAGCQAHQLQVTEVTVAAEPSTAFIDATRDALRGDRIEVVIGVGGGSVIDAAKALSAMLPHTHSVREHLEDVGTGRPHDGRKLPFIAVPTTSGTGGEMTKNAVLSEVGPQGYKKSLRHDAFIPDAVVVDAALMVSCPREITAACGMDAFTQLLEPYLSPKASPLTDALALSGMAALVPNLVRACGEGSSDLGVRGAVAYGSMLSGVCLANAGLGVVHGLASPLGGYFDIPHGVVCGTLVAEAMALNLAALRGRGDAKFLTKLAKVAEIFGASPLADSKEQGDHLVAALREWTRKLELPKLARYGITAADLPRVVAGASNRQNPVALTPDEMIEILARRL